MSKASLESNIRKLAFGWATAGTVLALILSGLLLLVLVFKDAERHIQTLASSVIESHRTDLLSGDVRAMELQLRKALSIGPDDMLLFLDKDRKPWTADSNVSARVSCARSQDICWSWMGQRVSIERAIHFDDEKRSLWGYLHIEKASNPNWSVVLLVVVAAGSGILLQSVGFYFDLMKRVRNVSAMLSHWATRLSHDPKNLRLYDLAPYSELEPIRSALGRLKAEIDLLEKRAREQGALNTLRGVGHDILNPVARMKRILGLMQIEAATNTAFDRQLLQKLNSNLSRLSSYAEQLKHIYKGRVGESLQSAPSLDVSKEVVTLASELAFHPDSIDKNIQVVTEVEGECPVCITTAALGRIVENLCANSIHASSNGATIKLSTKRIGNSVQISVEDAGCGIPAGNLDHMFDPEFTTGANQGTGLGLYVVKQICDQFGGTIRVNSLVGIGTKFQITFPVVEVSDGLQITLG